MTMSKIKILAAEDDEDIRDLIHFNLFKENYEVFLAKDGAEAIKLAFEHTPDLAILDIMMPHKDGITCCKEIKNNPATENMNIILLTAKGTEEDIVLGLEAGADDYITKPFSPKILMARVKAILRRKAGRISANQETILKHDISMNLVKRQVRLEDQPIDLTYTEFQLLHLLLTNPGWVYTRSQIVDLIRGENHAITDRSVDVQVVGLRKKLKDKGQLIESVRGVGYRMKEEELGK